MKQKIIGIIAALALVLAMAGPATAKAGASITAGTGPYHFGTTVPTFDLVASWVGKHGPQPSFGYWARADCYQSNVLVYAQYQSLTTTTQQAGWTFGPTPLWSSGGASCILRLDAIDDAVDHYIASASFTVLP